MQQKLKIKFMTTSITIEELKKITKNSEHKIILYSREPLHGDLAKLPANWENKILSWPPKYLWTNIRLSLNNYFCPCCLQMAQIL